MEVVERFLGFVDVSQKQDANALFNSIKGFFDVNGVKEPIVAQSYDGAAVMSGKFNGVQQKVKTVHPSAIYIHCMAHRVNLLILDTCKIVKVCCNLFWQNILIFLKLFL